MRGPGRAATVDGGRGAAAIKHALLSWWRKQHSTLTQANPMKDASWPATPDWCASHLGVHVLRLGHNVLRAKQWGKGGASRGLSGEGGCSSCCVRGRQSRNEVGKPNTAHEAGAA